MSLLRDEEIIAAITAQGPAVPYVEGVVLPADPYYKDSPVQASSIDLHIGNIYLPGEKESDLGGAQNPKQDYSLKTGETAVVTTLEVLHLPPDVAAFGFPPSRVSFKGLLMTNPGHVDPGYAGVMRFTVINMAKDAYHLERGGQIVTLLIFRMNDAAHRNWSQRNPAGGRLPNHGDISRLSRDFVNVDERAEKIAKKNGIKWSAAITAAVALVTVLLQLLGSGRLFSRADIDDLKKRQETVEYDLKNRVNIEQKLQDFDIRLKDLERANAARNASTRTLNAPRKKP
jgi:dCTP deaminase